jgi:hypothetical protein
MRYANDDNFGTPETAFLVCNFWYIDALAAVGRRRGAVAVPICWRTGMPSRYCPRTFIRKPGALGQHPAELLRWRAHQFGAAPVGQMGGCVAPRLIVVSNRVAVPGAKAPRHAGGLAVAVDAALKRRGGIWFGWSGMVAEDGAAPQPTVVRRRNGRLLRSISRTSIFKNFTMGSPIACCGRSCTIESIWQNSSQSNSPGI